MFKQIENQFKPPFSDKTTSKFKKDLNPVFSIETITLFEFSEF
jgi:hypothetical protein